MSEKGKQVMFSLDQFIILIAWLGAIFAILYFGEKFYEYIFPSIIAFIILNAAIGLWIRKVTHPIEKKSYRQYLTVQTFFLMIWGPLLILILSTNRTDLVPTWIIILVVFYIGIGVAGGRKILLTKKKK